MSGDFNQWKVENYLCNFADIKEVDVGFTRKDKVIDRIFLNMTRSVVESGTLEPLETEEEDASPSDHRIAYCRLELARVANFKWETFTYRYFNDQAKKDFKAWIVLHDWAEVRQARGSNDMTNAYQGTLSWAIDKFFPLKTTRRKTTDLPWINKSVLKKIDARKRLYWAEGGKRTAAWRDEKKKTDDLIKARKKGYVDTQKEHLLAKDANRNFFRHVKTFSRLEKPAQFDVRTLYESKTDKEISEDLANYFVRISREFDPLEPDQIPITADRNLPVLQNFEVAGRIRKFRKPKSMVPGDIFPSLMTDFSDFFAMPLTLIYNEITTSRIWPACWKKEYVTVIPKTASPTALGDLRNISCTLLASKIYESYVLDWLKSEVRLRTNQYGGVRGLGTDHVLVQMWQRMLEDLDDYRAATVVTSIDYSKAFNRMSFQKCLLALAKKGACNQVLQLVATFLTNRRMVVKVGQTHSDPKEVWGGCPQGSILGVFLFNATIDDLEEGCDDLNKYEPLKLIADTEPSDNSPAPEQIDNVEASSDEDFLEAPQENAVGRPVSSTPIRRRSFDPGQSPILSYADRSKRKRKLKRLSKRLNISSECRLEVPPEPNAKTEAKWRARLMDLLRYIDDGFGLSKINFENSYGFQVNGQFCRSKHAIQAQNVFRHVVRAAENIGMVVNAKKTAMICVSDSLKYQAESFIYDADGERIGCQERIKALGMYFANKPTMEEHVASIAKRFKARYWTLRNLKNSGFSSEELVTVYKTIIRPVADYACAVYHPSLTDQQDEDLDRLQNHALKCIFGPDLSGRKLRELAGVTTLRARREEITEKFAKKLVASPLFTHWFPLKQARSSRRSTVQQETYLEEKARCDRLHNSPLFYYRRVLNGKQGRTYGKRYEEYRL